MFDSKILNQLALDVGQEVLPQLMSVFKSESTDITEQLLTHSSLTPDSERLSHSLKSCAKSYGAIQLSQVAEQIERAAQIDDVDAFLNHLTQLKQTHSETMQALSELGY